MRVWWWAMAFVAVMMALGWVLLAHSDKARRSCEEERGGVMVRTGEGWTCIKAQRL